MHPNKIYFKEEQTFKQSPRMWILIAAAFASVAPIAYGLYQQLVLGKPWGDQPISDKNLIYTFVFIFILMVGLVILFSRIKLQVWVDDQGIRYRFPFFIIKEKIISREQINRYEIRTYRPLLEYGGWGYKTAIHRKLKGLNKSGTAMTIMGKTGLQLYLEDGQKLLIGTQRPDAFRRAMDKMMAQKMRNE